MLLPFDLSGRKRDLTFVADVEADDGATVTHENEVRRVIVCRQKLFQRRFQFDVDIIGGGVVHILRRSNVDGVCVVF